MYEWVIREIPIMADNRNVLPRPSEGLNEMQRDGWEIFKTDVVSPRTGSVTMYVTGRKASPIEQTPA